MELGANGLRAEVGELAQMAPGTLLPLGRSANQPASLIVAGVEMFGAAPARVGNSRAAKVLARSTESEAAISGSKGEKRR